MMRDLMQDDPSHLTAKQLRVMPIEAHKRAAVDADLVRKHTTVVAATSGERYTLVEAEQRFASGRFLFDHDLHVRYASAQIRWQRVERILRVLLELLCRIERIAFHSASEPCTAKNAENENDRSRKVHADIMSPIRA